MRIFCGIVFVAIFVVLAVHAEPIFISAPIDALREDCKTLVVAREVTNRLEVAKAVWRTTGLGVYEAYVNGSADGRFVLKPGFTHTRKRRQEFIWVSRAKGLEELGVKKGKVKITFSFFYFLTNNV